MRIQISKCCQLHDPTWAAHCQERLWKNFHHLPVYPDVNLLFSHKLPFVMVSVRSNEPVLTVNCCDCFLCRISGFLSASALSFVQAVMNDLCQRQKIVVVIPIWPLHTRFPQWPAKCALELLSQTLFTLCRGVSRCCFSLSPPLFPHWQNPHAILSDLIYANPRLFWDPSMQKYMKTRNS